MNFNTDISIRDFLAAIALNGILSSEGPSRTQDIEQDCQIAYQYADAMTKARHSTKTPTSLDDDY